MLISFRNSRAILYRQILVLGPLLSQFHSKGYFTGILHKIMTDHLLRSAIKLPQPLMLGAHYHESRAQDCKVYETASSSVDNTMMFHLERSVKIKPLRHIVRPTLHNSCSDLEDSYSKTTRIRGDTEKH